MSLPKRPDVIESPVQEHRSRRRHHDEEAGYTSVSMAPPSPTRHSRGPSKTSFAETLPSPLTPTPTNEQMAQPLRTGATEIHRKRSLIRPERNRIDRDHPNYHYRQHAANMPVLPSSTGNDPIYEDLEVDAAATETSGLRSSNEAGSDASPPLKKKSRRGRGAGPDDMISTEKAGHGARSGGNKLTRERTQKMTKEEKERQKQLDTVRPPSLWNVYCAFVTFWCPDFILSCFGKPARAQKRAWREKMGLISIILLIMAFVGFLTFGFTATVCGNPSVRLRVNEVSGGYMIFHGSAYDL